MEKNGLGYTSFNMANIKKINNNDKKKNFFDIKVTSHDKKKYNNICLNMKNDNSGKNGIISKSPPNTNNLLFNNGNCDISAGNISIKIPKNNYFLRSKTEIKKAEKDKINRPFKKKQSNGIEDTKNDKNNYNLEDNMILRTKNIIINNNEVKLQNQNHNNNNVSTNNPEISFKEEIIKIFIYMFYYEQNLNKNKYNSFNEQEKYYLINPKWIENYKNYYNYEKFYEIFVDFNKTNKSINYNNLENNIKNIFNELLKRNMLYEEKELSDDLLNFTKINCLIAKNYNISFISKGFIFPSKIIGLMKNIVKNIDKNIQIKELYFRNDKIIYINKQKK